SHAIAVSVAFALITLFHLVAGEQVPKLMALQRAEATTLVTAQFTTPLSVVFRPVIAVIYTLTDLALRPLHLKFEGEKHLVYTVEELEMLVVASTEGGQLEESEQEIIQRVFSFADVTAHQ